MSDHFAFLDLDGIVPSKTNPRTHFDHAKLLELSESIKLTEVHQPILVRPLPADRVEETSTTTTCDGRIRKVRPTHELVCGERRYRASGLAMKTTIPAMIRQLTDDQVLEIQLIENLQREDLTEIEEAEGYALLMQHSSINADTLGEKIGKSRSYVYARLKLLDLSIECKQAMHEGKIDSSRAILIARIPDAKLQAKALEEAIRPDWRGDVCSVRALQAWLQSNVMLRLENAPFKTTDARLVPTAGNCKECPKRTGANPDLFVDVVGADICTDPTCYHGKVDAHRATLVTKAEAKGMRVIEGKEAKEVFPHVNSSMRGYSALGQVRNDCTGNDDEKLTLRDLLGKDAPSPVLIENPHTKELIEAVPTEEAEALLLAKGLIKSTEKQEDIEDEIQHLQEQVKVKTARAQFKAKQSAVVDAIRATTDKEALQLLPAAVLRAWFETMPGYIDADDTASWFDMSPESLGEDPQTTVAMHVRACSNAALHRALARFMLNDDNMYANQPNQLIADAMAANLAIDTAAIEKAAASEVKAEVAAELKRLKAELKQSTAPKTSTATAPAAQANGGAGESKKTKSALRVPKPKLRAEEAMLGIAAAMQSDEASDSARRSEEITGADAHGNDGGADFRPTDAADASSTGQQGRVSALVDDMHLFNAAVHVIKREQKANVRLLKSELKVGTSKALDLMAKLEAAGKVSACDERGARKVLVPA
jgi:ParB/RepB/Spo0J family partition protein